MAKIIRHKDESSGASLYPITKQSAVYDDVGKSLDVTITDINNDIEKKENKHQRITITIPTSAWVNNTCVMTVTGVLTTSTLMVSPVYESEQAYSASGVCCVSQDINELTFTCTSAPEEDLVVNVVVFGSASELNLDDASIAQLLNSIQENNAKVAELETAIDSIEDNVSDYAVNKAGDTMTGKLLTSKEHGAFGAASDDKSVRIDGGSDYDKGAFLTLFGKDNADSPGHFQLVAVNNDARVELRGNPYGDLTWNNNEVLHTGNKNLITPADIGAAKADLSNASGTLGGQVIANAASVATIGTAQVRNIKAGTTDLTAGSSTLATGEIYFVYE